MYNMPDMFCINLIFFKIRFWLLKLININICTYFACHENIRIRRNCISNRRSWISNYKITFRLPFYVIKNFLHIIYLLQSIRSNFIKKKSIYIIPAIKLQISVNFIFHFLNISFLIICRNISNVFYPSFLVFLDLSHVIHFNLFPCPIIWIYQHIGNFILPKCQNIIPKRIFPIWISIRCSNYRLLHLCIVINIFT